MSKKLTSLAFCFFVYIIKITMGAITNIYINKNNRKSRCILRAITCDINTTQGLFVSNLAGEKS